MSEAESPEAARSGPEPSEKRRLLRLLAVFAAVGAVVVGVPLVYGIVQARRAAAEARIVGQLRAYKEAQYAWHREGREGSAKLRYVQDYTRLVDFKDAPEAARKLVDPAFAAARGADGAPKHGCRYREMRTIFGSAINCDGDFAICATPAVYGKTGRKTYIMKTDGDVWAKDLGKSEFVSDFPSGVEGAGWQKAEPSKQ